MSKPPPKKREPTLRELLERDAKYPLREIGLFDEFDKTPMENAVSDLDFQKLGQAHEVLDRKNKLDFVEKRDEHKVPMPRTSVAEFIVDAFLGAKPAGVRGDTELAMMREANPELAQSRRRMAFINQVGQGFAPQPFLGSLRDLLGVPRKVSK